MPTRPATSCRAASLWCSQAAGTSRTAATHTVSPRRWRGSSRRGRRAGPPRSWSHITRIQSYGPGRRRRLVSMNDRRRWVILAVGTYAQAATCTFIYGIPMLVPRLLDDGLSLFQTGLLVSAPMAGLLLTLIAWGALADLRGERVVIATG